VPVADLLRNANSLEARRVASPISNYIIANLKNILALLASLA
jgi:hypothetical protein